MSKIKLGLDTYLMYLASSKSLTIEEQEPFKAKVSDVVYLRITDGEYSIPAIYSEECREELRDKFEYISCTELENVNIMINKYSYILHEPTEHHTDNYRGMCLQIVIHSLKPLLNEIPINGAGINVLQDESIKAGLKRYKYKRMQNLLMCTDKEYKQAETSNISQGVSMRSESEHSHFSSLSSQLPALTAVFDKMVISGSNFNSENSSEKDTCISGLFDLNTHTCVSGSKFSTYEAHTKPSECSFNNLINHHLNKVTKYILKLSHEYIQEMSEEDLKQRQLRIKMEIDQENNKRKN